MTHEAGQSDALRTTREYIIIIIIVSDDGGGGGGERARSPRPPDGRVVAAVEVGRT